MLLLFSFRIAEWPSIWERAVHYSACLSWTFTSRVYVLFSLLVLSIWCGCFISWALPFFFFTYLHVHVHPLGIYIRLIKTNKIWRSLIDYDTRIACYILTIWNTLDITLNSQTPSFDTFHNSRYCFGSIIHITQAFYTRIKFFLPVARKIFQFRHPL